MSTMISKLFDRLLELNDGELIELTFNSPDEARSKKTLLYREKKKWEEAQSSRLCFKSVFITQDLRGGNCKLRLSLEGSELDYLFSAVVKKKDGTETKLDAPATDNNRLEILKQME